MAEGIITEIEDIVIKTPQTKKQRDKRLKKKKKHAQVGLILGMQG